MAERERWRMTLQELMHRVKARPSDLEAWAKLGALGPAWQETTENKWRHITKKCANRAIVMREMLDAGLEPKLAAELADAHADKLAAGETVKVVVGRADIEFDPARMELE